MRVTRRGLLLGSGAGVAAAAGGGALVEYDVLPGRVWAYEHLGLNGDAGRIPDVEPGELARGTLDGAAWWVSRPPGATGELPVVLALHGARMTAETLLERVGLDRFLAASGQGFAIAAIDGGDSGYWHPRADGRDPRGLVLDRFLPLLAADGLATTAPGLLGWSMGGYGALLLATGLETPGPVLAVSPAVWSHREDAAPGAFDGAADFEEWGVFGRTDDLVGLEVRVDCGRGDPFYRNVLELEDAAPGLDVRIEAGGHDYGYWTRELPGQLAWLGERV